MSEVVVISPSVLIPSDVYIVPFTSILPFMSCVPLNSFPHRECVSSSAVCAGVDVAKPLTTVVEDETVELFFLLAKDVILIRLIIP